MSKELIEELRQAADVKLADCPELFEKAADAIESQAATIARYETTAENCDMLRDKVEAQAREIERLTQERDSQQRTCIRAMEELAALKAQAAPEAGPVEVVAWRGKDQDGGEGFSGAKWPDAFGSDCCVEPLMTVAQHNRIMVGAREVEPFGDAALDAMRKSGLSIDGDNAYKRDLLDSVVGALAFGKQRSTPPPAGHWLEAFYAIGQAEADERYAAQQHDAELVELLRDKFPRIDPCAPVPLDEKAHCCEYTIYVERERLHRLINAALSANP